MYHHSSAAGLTLFHHLMTYAGPSPGPLTILGETTFRQQSRRFGITAEDRRRHVYIIGKTGSGKSTLTANMVAQDLEAGHGLALLDPHGALVEAVLRQLPRHREQDLVLFEPGDPHSAISFNVFRSGRKSHPNRARLTAELIGVFRAQFAGNWGPRTEHILRNALLAVSEDPNATMLLLYRFLAEAPLRDALVAKVQDPLVKHFWLNEFAGYRPALQAEATAPVLNKLGAFVSNPFIRPILGQVRSRLDPIEVMDHRRVLLANLGAGVIGQDAAHLLGGLLISALFMGALARGRADPPLFLYLDEFQHFVNDSVAGILSEARKFGLSLTLAHQYLGQVDQGVLDAVIGNVGSMITMRVGADDALRLAPEFSPQFSAAELQTLQPFHAAMKLTANGQTLTPFSARTLPPKTDHLSHARVEALRAASRNRYARSRSAVDAFIHQGLSS